MHPEFNCPCTVRQLASSATPPPSFVGNDYFCDTGRARTFQAIFYGDDPEQVVDQIMTAALSTILHGFVDNYHLPQLMILSCVSVVCICPVDEDTPVEVVEINVQ